MPRANRDRDLTHVHDAKGASRDRYGVEVLPDTIVIDCEGRWGHVAP